MMNGKTRMNSPVPIINGDVASPRIPTASSPPRSAARLRDEADGGRWGHYSWSAMILGVHSQRIAGGTDEIQRNIISERVLGLPRGPSVDSGKPFRDVPKNLAS